MVSVRHCSSRHTNGFVDRHIIVKIAEHINKHARKPISSDKGIVILVDENSSRDGLEWHETCKRLNIIVVRLPASTTHILQPCDQYVNRSSQRTVRKTSDELLSMSHLSWANTTYKIKSNWQLLATSPSHPTMLAHPSSNAACGLWNTVLYTFLPLMVLLMAWKQYLVPHVQVRGAHFSLRPDMGSHADTKHQTTKRNSSTD